jgi:excinuclease ABC subunit A
MVEHNMQVAGTCDYIIDMGPGAGEEGGCIVAEGSPEEVAKVQQSATASFLKAILAT